MVVSGCEGVIGKECMCVGSWLCVHLSGSVCLLSLS